jgi:ABC-2 type transport system ATP-binding protein
MAETVIQISNLSVILGENFPALVDVNLDLPRGKVIGFIGPSGAGKTTLIRAIVGRQSFKSGKIIIDGIAAGSPKLRSQISYMTQELSVYPDLTVTENLGYFSTMFGLSKADSKKIVQTILSTVEMADFKNQLVSKLSGGQKQRVSLAVALIGSPPLMVLDEPTVGLDPVLREQLWELFRQLALKGTTLIISSHVMDEAERCDDLVLIREGKILAHDTPKNLIASTGTKTVEQSFLKLVGKTK